MSPVSNCVFRVVAFCLLISAALPAHAETTVVIPEAARKVAAKAVSDTRFVLTYVTGLNRLRRATEELLPLLPPGSAPAAVVARMRQTAVYSGTTVMTMPDEISNKEAFTCMRTTLMAIAAPTEGGFLSNLAVSGAKAAGFKVDLQRLATHAIVDAATLGFAEVFNLTMFVLTGGQSGFFSGKWFVCQYYNQVLDAGVEAYHRPELSAKTAEFRQKADATHEEVTFNITYFKLMVAYLTALKI